MTERIHLVRAKKTDLEVLLPMVEAFHTLFGIKHTAESRRCALEPCLREEGPAAIWLIVQGEHVVGYLVLAFGYSLEFGGRDAFVDEVFLLPDYRGKGIGGMALWLLTEEARALGVFAMHLEVRQDDPQAQRLYQRSGFVPRSRYFLMTHRLTPQASENVPQSLESNRVTP